jgi:hypothetical protein
MVPIIFSNIWTKSRLVVSLNFGKGRQQVGFLESDQEGFL